MEEREVAAHPQAPHVFQRQSTGHGSVLHGATSDDDPAHGDPPPDAGFCVRVRVRVPPPHVTEHVLHWPHVFHVQCTM